MNDLGLFAIKTRIQPILPDSYILTVKFSKETETFYARLYHIYKHKTLHLYKIKKRRWLKGPFSTWHASFESNNGKNIEQSQSRKFSHYIQFRFDNELDMIDAQYALNKFLDDIVTEEFIKYQIALNSKSERY